MRTFAAMFVSGALGLLLLKLLLGLVGPLLAMMLGLFALAFKLALFAAVAYFIYSLVRGRKREREEVL
jgi:TctA family transporter